MRYPLLLLAPLLLVLAMSCTKKPVDTPPDPLLLQGNVEIVRDVVILYSDSMRLQARVEGPRLVKYLDRDEERDEFPDGVKVTFYERDGQPSSTLVADFGVRQPRKKLIRAIGNVVFENTSGERLDSEELIWDEEADRVYTRKFVVITTPEEKVWGMGFEANQQFTRRRIFAPEGRLQIEGPAEE
jgi:LPS export ABC transporter protein LptC